jgi:hypothetical protein
MLVVICNIRRSSYQPLCLKMLRRKPPNPRSSPRPRAVFVREIKKNTADRPTQTGASPPGKPWRWVRRQATAAHRPSRQGTNSIAIRNLSSVTGEFSPTKNAHHSPAKRYEHRVHKNGSCWSSCTGARASTPTSSMSHEACRTGRHIVMWIGRSANLARVSFIADREGLSLSLLREGEDSEESQQTEQARNHFGRPRGMQSGAACQTGLAGKFLSHRSLQQGTAHRMRFSSPTVASPLQPG